jgi:hypothetical protein
MHQRRPLHLLDDVRDGEGLAGARDSQQRLVREPVLQPFDEARDGFGLVARGFVAGLELKPARDVGHAAPA